MSYVNAQSTDNNTVPSTQSLKRTEVAFVLDNVADCQVLAAGVRPGVEVAVLAIATTRAQMDADELRV